MFDTFMEGLLKILKSRLLPILIIFGLLIAVLIHRIFVLQIVQGEEYAQKQTIKSEKPRELKATRGNICDKDGNILAYNELSYTVTIEDTGELATNDEKNAMIYKLIGLIKHYNGTIVSDFAIELDKDGNFVFNIEGSALNRFKRNVYSLSTSDELTKEQKDATATDIFNYLRFGNKVTSMFHISEDYSLEDALEIMTIRYSMYMNRYQKYVRVTVASDVSEEIVAAVKENSANLPGVEVLKETHRVYNDSLYFSHILGYTGLLSEEELSNDENKSYYSATDQIGKSGIEKEFENYLRGEKGYELLEVNELGKVLKVKKSVEPQAGNDVYLTIDKDLQIATYKMLEKQLAKILVSHINNGMSVGSKGKSADNIMIPIYDVYSALIQNNIIDVTRFTEPEATDLEKSVYQEFLTKQKEVLNNLESLLALNSKVKKKSLSDEKSEYLDYVYSTLKDKEILIRSKIDTSDSKYIAYTEDEISLSEFLQYAISNNWVDLNKLEIGKEYYRTDEIYKILLKYIRTTLEEDSNFTKRLYHYLVYTYKLSGTQICLLLFDQGVLKYDEEQIAKLKSGAVSAYNFMITRIKKLEITPAQLALEPCSGSVVVTDVKTGEVRALVSYPSYDNNKMANTVDPKYYNKLYHDKSTPFLNRPTQVKYAPGSTFKLLTSVAGLTEGVIRPNETIRDKGMFEKITHSPKCWIYPSNHGSVDVSNAIGVSCNYFFYEVGYRLGKDSNGNFNNEIGLNKLKKYANMFGLDSVSGIELPETTPNVSSEDAVRSSIGQGSNSYAPVQLSRYVTAVANKGTVYNLTLLDRIKDVKGKMVLNKKVDVYNEISLSDTTWNLVQHGMDLVVNGPKSSIKSLFASLDLNVAGKTGTAQISKSHPNHALFVSFAPYEKPEISVTVSIQNGYSSSNAAELGRNIYQYYFNLGDKDDLTKSDVNVTRASSYTVTD